MIACGADTLHESTIKQWEQADRLRHHGRVRHDGNHGGEPTTPYHRPKTGSFGVPLPGVDAAIVDVEGEECMPVGEDGELILSGPNIMQGYWRRPEGTAEAMMEYGRKALAQNRRPGENG
jgi:long-chain acyl-CoA synthetase